MWALPALRVGSGLLPYLMTLMTWPALPVSPTPDRSLKAKKRLPVSPETLKSLIVLFSCNVLRLTFST